MSILKQSKALTLPFFLAFEGANSNVQTNNTECKSFYTALQGLKRKVSKQSKPKQEQQVSKKVSKQKVQKFLQVLSVDILKEMSKKHHLPVSRLKEDLIRELIDAMDNMRVDWAFLNRQ